MQNYLQNLDKKLLEITTSIGEEADRKNIKAYLVGGIVRDLILDKNIFDLDIVIEGDAIPFAWDLSRRFNAKATVYPNFGTASLKLGPKTVIDIATARKEKYITPGALPIVNPGMLTDDMLRRDFTINAIAISINKDTWGNIVDKFKGMEDLKKKRLVVFHEKSFLEDPTRILRLVRFEQRFSFEIEKVTFSLFKTAIKKKYFQSVKPQRYFAEFKKILKEPDPIPCLKRLDELNAFSFLKKSFVPNMTLLKKIKKEIGTLSKSKELNAFEDWWKIYLFALLEGLGNKDFSSFLEKISLSNKDKDPLVQSRNVKGIIKKISLKNCKKSVVYRVLIDLNREMIIYLFIRSNSSVVRKRINDFLSKTRFVKLGIDGDLVKRKGLQPGKIIGELLGAVLDAKIDGKVRNKREEEGLVKKLIIKAKSKN